MFKKSAALILSLLLTAGFAGCNGSGADSSMLETTAPTEALVSRNLCYIIGNGTTDPDEISAFTADLEAGGFVWNESTFSDIPADTDAVIFNSPTEDLTRDDMEALNAYMDEGGHLLLLLPAYEGEVRFKYLSQFLEKYCISFDYDRISETDLSRTIGEDAYFIQTDYIARPDNMPLYSSVQESGIVVVDIWVDNYGNVQKAVAGAEGTTVTDKTLWQAARKAALGAHFNMSGDAPALQKGTITYIFKLN